MYPPLLFSAFALSSNTSRKSEMLSLVLRRARPFFAVIQCNKHVPPTVLLKTLQPANVAALPMLSTRQPMGDLRLPARRSYCVVPTFHNENSKLMLQIMDAKGVEQLLTVYQSYSQGFGYANAVAMFKKIVKEGAGGSAETMADPRFVDLLGVMGLALKQGVMTQDLQAVKTGLEKVKMTETPLYAQLSLHLSSHGIESGQDHQYAPHQG